MKLSSEDFHATIKLQTDELSSSHQKIKELKNKYARETKALTTEQTNLSRRSLEDQPCEYENKHLMQLNKFDLWLLFIANTSKRYFELVAQA